MKKLGLVLLAFMVAVWFGACGDSKDSKDSYESQTINANDSQSESDESSAVSNIDSIKPAQDFNVLNQNATICDDSYKEKVCGGDALLCSANKCLYKNLTNIDEAFKFYVGQEIKKVAFSKERNERDVLVYKYMLGIALPKENESKKITTSIEDYYSKQYGTQNQCDFEFKRTSDSLMIEFNNCDDSESNTIIFTQKGEAVEIIKMKNYY